MKRIDDNEILIKYLNIATHFTLQLM